MGARSEKTPKGLDPNQNAAKSKCCKTEMSPNWNVAKLKCCQIEMLPDHPRIIFYLNNSQEDFWGQLPVNFSGDSGVDEVLGDPENLLRWKPVRTGNGLGHDLLESVRKSFDEILFSPKDIETEGQFHGTKLSVISSQVEQNLRSTFKTRENL